MPSTKINAKLLLSPLKIQSIVSSLQIYFGHSPVSSELRHVSLTLKQPLPKRCLSFLMLVLIQLTAMYITKSVSGLMTKCY